MSRYKLYYDGKVILEPLAGGHVRTIPIDPAGWAYQEFLDWDAIPGNDPDPADPAPQPDPQDLADRATLADLIPVYQNLLDGLNAIEATRAALDVDATTLSTITVANVAAIQTVLRKLGTDLLVMNDNIDKLARGNERILRTLAALKRNLGR